MIDGVSSQPFSALTLSPIGSVTGSKEKVIKVSRERYAKTRALIEEKILRWSGMELGGDEDDDEEKKPVERNNNYQKNNKSFSNSNNENRNFSKKNNSSFKKEKSFENNYQGKKQNNFINKKEEKIEEKTISLKDLMSADTKNIVNFNKKEQTNTAEKKPNSQKQNYNNKLNKIEPDQVIKFDEDDNKSYYEDK